MVAENFYKLGNDLNRKVRKKYGFKQEDCIFTFVGRFSREKGADKFLRALEILGNQKNIKALVVGDSFLNSTKEVTYRKELLDKASKLKEKICFTGYVSNQRLSRIYSISDCIVIPSQVEEAFGMVALEAMIMKKPVIASKAGGLTEVLSPNGSIFLNLDCNFTKNLAKAMLTLASSEALREKMGTQNYLKSKQFPQNNSEYFKMMARILNQH